MTFNRSIKIAPSILSADFANFGQEIEAIETQGCDWVHVDVMDGHFVDNITFGADFVAAFRRLTELPLDVHLMITEPSRYLDRYVDAGASSITFHVEVPEPTDVVTASLARIADAGTGVGLAVSPSTPVEILTSYVDALDMILVMTVEPGWGGQVFIKEAAGRIGPARDLLATAGRGGLVHVDGGINRDTAHVVGAQGVDVAVVGSALFQRGRDAADEVNLVRERLVAARDAGYSIEPAPTPSVRRHRESVRRVSRFVSTGGVGVVRIVGDVVVS